MSGTRITALVMLEYPDTSRNILQRQVCETCKYKDHIQDNRCTKSHCSGFIDHQTKVGDITLNPCCKRCKKYSATTDTDLIKKTITKLLAAGYPLKIEHGLISVSLSKNSGKIAFAINLPRKT